MKFRPVLCSESLWESLVHADESATFFQTPAWHRIVAAQLDATPAPLLFDFPAGPACLPLLRDIRWGRQRYFSPFGTYTAVVCPRKLTPDEIAVIEAALQTLNIHLTSSPFTQNRVRVGHTLPTHVQTLDLTNLDPGNAARDWDADPRRKLRMARENGVRVRAADSGNADEKDWATYYTVYQKSLQRWGGSTTSSYPESLFADISKLPGDAVKLWVAEHEGKIAAGYVAFYHNRHACIWHGASDPEMFRTGAVQALYHDMTTHAAQAGYTVFDLLGSGGTASLEAFKASLGAKPLQFDSFLNRTGLVGKLAALRDSFKNDSATLLP